MSERDKKGDFRKPDGFFRGNTVGHSDERGRVRGPDGVFFPGDELGYLDQDGQIRKPDGFFLRGEAVGQVKEKTAYDKDGWLLSGEEWGYVDDQGNVRLKDGFFLKGRIVGQARGNPQSALTFFVLQFQKIVDKAAELEREISNAADKTRFLGRVHHMLQWVPEANALGDFDALIRRLQRLESQIERQLLDNKHSKEILIGKARELSGSSDWRGTTELIKDLQNRWKAIGPVPKADADALWERFRNAIDLFFTRKKEHAASREREQHANLSRKKHLVARAESLANSSDWKSAGEAMKALQAEWKAVGHVPREQADALWQEFRQAQDRFYARRTAHFEQRDREREKKQAEWRSQMRETLARKREQASRLEESIEHDQETVSRWRDTIDNLRPGPKASEIRESLNEKIYSVAAKIQSKRERLRELVSAIHEIEGKL